MTIRVIVVVDVSGKSRTDRKTQKPLKIKTSLKSQNNTGHSAAVIMRAEGLIQPTALPVLMPNTQTETIGSGFKTSDQVSRLNAGLHILILTN